MKSIYILRYVITISSFFFLQQLQAEEGPPQLINVVDSSVKDSFGDKFSENSGHRVELIKAKLFTLDKKLAKEVTNLIGEKLLALEHNSKNQRMKLELRQVIFNYSNYLLQMQGFSNDDGVKKAYVAGSPGNHRYQISERLANDPLPLTLILPDGGGVFYWQAYVNIEDGVVDIVFNDDF